MNFINYQEGFTTPELVHTNASALLICAVLTCGLLLAIGFTDRKTGADS